MGVCMGKKEAPAKNNAEATSASPKEEPKVDTSKKTDDKAPPKKKTGRSQDEKLKAPKMETSKINILLVRKLEGAVFPSYVKPHEGMIAKNTLLRLWRRHLYKRILNY